MYVSINVPEIDEYPEGFPQYWLKTLFISPVSSSFQINALASTYVRLVEAALVEYRLGYLKLKEFWGTHTSVNLGAMHRSVSHFESCLSDMYRDGPGWLDRIFLFLSGASRGLPMRRYAGSAGYQSTLHPVCDRQAFGAALSGYKTSGSAPIPGARR